MSPPQFSHLTSIFWFSFSQASRKSVWDLREKYATIIVLMKRAALTMEAALLFELLRLDLASYGEGEGMGDGSAEGDGPDVGRVEGDGPGEGDGRDVGQGNGVIIGVTGGIVGGGDTHWRAAKSKPKTTGGV